MTPHTDPELLNNVLQLLTEQGHTGFAEGKQQLRENVTRPGHRPLAMEFAAGFIPRRNSRLWNRLHGYMLRFGRRAADNFVRLTLARRQRHQTKQKYEHKITRMLGE